MIFALDRGSSQSALCTLDTCTGAVRHSLCRTQAARIRTPLQRPRPNLVVIQILPLAALVHDVAVSLGIAIQVADATQEAWRWRSVPPPSCGAASWPPRWTGSRTAPRGAPRSTNRATAWVAA